MVLCLLLRLGEPSLRSSTSRSQPLEARPTSLTTVTQNRNAPYILGVRALAFPLAAGNTVILKGSEFCPKLWYTLGGIFHEAGLPKGVLNVLFHAPASAAEVTNTLIAHPSIKKINFTGSTMVGGIIASIAGKHIKPVLLELGGKASAIVCEDADLGKAAQWCAVGAFLHGGQICMSTERVLVHKNIKEKFVELFKEKVKGMWSAEQDAPVLVAAAGVAKTRKLIEGALAVSYSFSSFYVVMQYAPCTFSLLVYRRGHG